MIARIIILCVGVLFSVQVYGQGSAERQAFNNIQKGKWEKAFGQLNKALSKDTMNVAAAYVLAHYYFSPDNPDFNLDSAYRYTQKAYNDFQSTPDKQRERLNRFPLDSLILVELRQQIDYAAFERAQQLDTEQGYVDFLSYFTHAAQRPVAVTLRNKAAYRQALKDNTFEAFNGFLSKYPDAEEVTEARLKYDELLFLDWTKDKRLASYQRYIKEYPNTAYKREAERNIFEIVTASGSVESYKSFLISNPSSPFAKRAQNILFHLVPVDQRDEEFPTELTTDSLRTIVGLERGYLVPFLHGGRFGFMNHKGVEISGTGTDEISNEYRCGDISVDVIALPQRLIALNGTTIHNRPVESFEDLGSGFILIVEDSCSRLLHKTGFTVGDSCVQDAKVLNGKFLGLKKGENWSLWTLSGRMLLPYGWEDIVAIKDVIVLKSKSKVTLTTDVALAKLADQQKLGLNEFVDEVKGWRNDFIWVKHGENEAVFNQRLDTIIHLKKHTLSPAYFGFTAATDSGEYTYNVDGEESRRFQRLLIKEPWTAARTDTAWYLFDPKARRYQSSRYDSISIAGPFAIGMKKDSIRVFFSENKFMNVAQPVRADFIRGDRESSSFLILEQGDKKSIYTAEGKKLLTVKFDHIQYAGEGYFTVSKKEKKGLITSAGKPLLPLEFDAIGTVNKGVVTLLTRNKFGLFDCKTRKLIKPQYSKNLTCYNTKVIAAYKDGIVSLIGWDNKPLSKMEFAEVQYWNDSVALVRKDSHWMLYEVKNQKVVLDKITNVKFIRDGLEKLAIVQQDRKFGVIDNKKGIIIPITFSDIINVGSPSEPLYFTEKHVEEASIFVVIYYDSMGIMLRKEVYEQDDYEKIYCSHN